MAGGIVMSPTTIRSPRTVKRDTKTAVKKPTSKKTGPVTKKAAASSARSVGRTQQPVSKPVRTVKVAEPKPETKAKSKPVKSAAPLKRDIVVNVEKPKKKKAERENPEPKLESTPVKSGPAPDMGESMIAPKRPGRPPKAAKEEPVQSEEQEAKKRGRKPSTAAKEKTPREKPGRGSKLKSLDSIDEFIADDLPATEDEVEEDAVIPENLEELDPLDLPLALLDPDLVEVPRPVGPTRPKPKPRVERQPKPCASCGQMFTWLSVDQLCFNCLKKKLAAKKREDESYGGYTPEAEDSSDDD
jgi:hypothetical protein